MSTSELKYSIFQLIDSISDESKLRVIYNSLKDDEGCWDSLPQEVKDDIDISLKQVETGNVISHEDVTAQLSKKYPQLSL